MSTQEVLIGNALDVLKGLQDESVDVVVTSPPYWALRDYMSPPQVWDGDPSCEHDWTEHRKPARGGIGYNANVGANRDGAANNRGHPTITHFCAKCGAWRGQLGLEPSPADYIRHLTAIFDEVHRVLKPTGAVFVNIGDTFNGQKRGNTETRKNLKCVTDSFRKEEVESLQSKCMLMIPERFAIAMCERGWVLRNKIVWKSPNKMPQSCTNRFTNDYEMVYFFTKEPTGYYFNQLYEPTADGHGSRIMRSVWDINTKASKLDHCAMFPTELVARPIQACCPPGGTVLDPFVGSGTTLEYCFAHGINGIGIEVNPAYKEIIEKRMSKGQCRLCDYDRGHQEPHEDRRGAGVPRHALRLRIPVRHLRGGMVGQ